MTEEATLADGAPAQPLPDTSIARWFPRLRDATVNGGRIRYLDAGEGPPVMLIHGIGCNWTDWAANLDGLTQQHRVIAVDMPGFGASDPLAPRSEMTATSDALVALLDEIGVLEFSVVGHSLGGLVAWLVAAGAPERVTRLGLVDSATVALNALQTSAIVNSFTWTGRSLARPAVARAILRRPRLRNLIIGQLFADAAGVTPELAVQLLTPLTQAPGFFDALWAGPRANKLLRADEMTTPTLIAWGTKDRIFSLRSARLLAAQMPDATLLEFPGARHFPQIEQPAAFDAALIDFLAQPPA